MTSSIAGLRRAINIRLKHLEEVYEFHALFGKQVGSLERLEQLGLARPFLITQLLEIRNKIEHRDALPPSVDRARELVDATWYFLRTTDSVCKLVPDGVMLHSVERASCLDPDLWPWLNITVLPGQRERFKISGWLPLDLLSKTEQAGFLLLEATSLGSKRSWPTEDPVDSISNMAYLSDAARGQDQQWITAQADVPQDLRRQIWRLAFEAL